MFLIIEKVLVKAILSSSSMPHVGSKVEYLSVPFLKKKNGIHSMQGRTATTRHGITRKRSKKRLKHTGNISRKNLDVIDVC